MLDKHSPEFKNTMIGSTGYNHPSGRTAAVGTGGTPVGQATNGTHGPEEGSQGRDEYHDAEEGGDAQEQDQEAQSEHHTARSERHTSHGMSSSYDPDEDEPWKLLTEELLPEFLQGWYLLADAGLEPAEKNLIQTAIQDDFSVERVAKELRQQWPDHDLKGRDQHAKYSNFWDDEAYGVDEDEELGQEENSLEC